ncbi:hypothetical protein BURMUCGD1_3552 [Burkholderia multivorans CGD1]|nr:hypothetical protein BURMUCGD1_3552 [Burkholderia multivorans CGD1]
MRGQWPRIIESFCLVTDYAGTGEAFTKGSSRSVTITMVNT